MLLICWLLIVYIFQGFKQVFVMLQLKNRPRHCGRNVENAGEQNFTRIGAREGYWITLAGKWVELDRLWAGSGPENGWTRLRLDSRWLGWFGTGLVMAKPLDSINMDLMAGAGIAADTMRSVCTDATPMEIGLRQRWLRGRRS